MARAQSENVDVEPMAHARAAAGALFFDEDGRVLLVRPSYKPGWEIPGGYLHPGETPSEAAAREILEELGIKPSIGRLLVVDWAPHPDEGDKVLFVFDGGLLDTEMAGRIRLEPSEIVEYAYCGAESIDEYLGPRLARRVYAGMDARATGRVNYLEPEDRPGVDV